MKKTCFYSLLAIIAALFIHVPVQATNVLTVFDGDKFGYSPINTPYLDEAGIRTQSIFPASDLGVITNEVINSVTFYFSEAIPVGQGVINVLVGETTQTAFYGNDYVEGLTQVATISMVPGMTELVITFDSPYYYQGGNLVIETDVVEPTECCYIPFIGYRPENYPTISRGEVSKFLPKVTFDYGTDEAFSAKVVPHEVTFNTIRAEREDIQSVILTNNGQNAFTATCSTLAPFVVDMEATELAAGASLEIPVTFAPMQAGEYNGALTINCGEAGILTATLKGTAIEAAIDIQIADSTDYASFVPIYGSDIDVVGTQSQIIYPADSLAELAGGKILAIKFQTKDYVQMRGGTIQMALKVVDQAEFRSATFVTGTTVVATTSPVFGSSELEFVFDEPFEYNGGNLLVECLITEPGTTNYRQTFFYGTPTEHYAGISKTLWYGSTFDIDLVPFLPLAIFSYQKAAALRGDVNNDRETNISDAIALVNAILNDSWDSINMTNADVDYSGTVDISDATKLINYILNGSWPN